MLCLCIFDTQCLRINKQGRSCPGSYLNLALRVGGEFFWRPGPVQATNIIEVGLYTVKPLWQNQATAKKMGVGPIHYIPLNKHQRWKYHYFKSESNVEEQVLVVLFIYVWLPKSHCLLQLDFVSGLRVLPSKTHVLSTSFRVSSPHIVFKTVPARPSNEIYILFPRIAFWDFFQELWGKQTLVFGTLMSHIRDIIIKSGL